MTFFKSIIIAVLLACSAWAHAAEVTPTENYLAYLNELLKHSDGQFLFYYRKP